MHLNGAMGELLMARFVRVEMKDRMLRGLLGKIDQRRVYFLNGEMQTGKIESGSTGGTQAVPVGRWVGRQ